MPEHPDSPGVYIEEIPAGIRSISGLPTSITLFIGRTAQGPLNEAVACLSYSDYEDVFSGDTTLGEMANQLELFFVNGGSACYVIRIEGDSQADDASENSPSPTVADYKAAFLIAEQQIDLFNLMVLPRDVNQALNTLDLHGVASVFCQSKRAFLLMDAPPGWTDVQIASSEANALRIGLVSDHAALFYPDVTINAAGHDEYVGPTGAIAGLMARIDASRGVWKAPAGTSATLRGIVGLQYQLSDTENSLMNTHAVNILRVFPTGVLNWGARTMAGISSFGGDYKYIPVRRLALYLEASIYRGLQWVGFEPNDEPLWAQIRLTVAAFMDEVFRQGAFQGVSQSEAYFVKCDSETTTQADINSDSVNVLIGFAPIKPAEFVVISLRLATG